MKIAQPSSSLFYLEMEKYRGDFVYFLVCTSLEPRCLGTIALLLAVTQP
jgi:hypothetical protein